MVLSAEYIKKKLEQEMVLSQAFGRDLVRLGRRGGGRGPDASNRERPPYPKAVPSADAMWGGGVSRRIRKGWLLSKVLKE